MTNNINAARSVEYSKQIMLYFVDFFMFTLPVFDKRRVYRIPIKEYAKFRQENKRRFSKTLYRLKRDGFVKKYFDGKQESLELLPKGQALIGKFTFDELKISSPQKWDKKWRLVIYDISNDKKNERDAIKRKLEKLGFLKLQESVFVFPFESLEIVSFMKGLFFLSPYIQYIVADRIETERDLIKEFYARGILKDSHLK